ncbi:MAG: hypothetical protein Q4F01_09790 [Staphylococcus rostri]|uniref:hypothetical protein n=1 Tax=Staphylococcus rostri TaxID=522262 RepID=UPI0026DF5050|nr:hypothetical protein [Staphylococcus rostri]MDO5376456.1 hypothetical protein [Staphylococcus rostri]
MEFNIKLIWFLIAAVLAVVFIFNDMIVALAVLLVVNIVVYIIIEQYFKRKK